jgi:hypothetical protein
LNTAEAACGTLTTTTIPAAETIFDNADDALCTTLVTKINDFVSTDGPLFTADPIAGYEALSDTFCDELTGTLVAEVEAALEAREDASDDVVDLSYQLYEDFQGDIADLTECAGQIDPVTMVAIDLADVAASTAWLRAVNLPVSGC